MKIQKTKYHSITYLSGKTIDEFCNGIKEEYKSLALDGVTSIGVVCTEEYDTKRAELEIYYLDEETKQEIAYREAQEARELEFDKKRYIELKKKFG